MSVTIAEPKPTTEKPVRKKNIAGKAGGLPASSSLLTRAGYQVVSMVTVAEAKEEVKRYGSADL